MVGKLDVLRIACDKCGRKGRYALTSIRTDAAYDVAYAMLYGAPPDCRGECRGDIYEMAG